MVLKFPIADLNSMNSSLFTFRMAFFVSILAGFSLVAINLCPFYIPSAPIENAAFAPWPSTIPPAAITGIFTSEVIWGTRKRTEFYNHSYGHQPHIL